jgi:hypothetical protein
VRHIPQQQYFYWLQRSVVVMIGQVERCDIETLNLPTNDIIAAVLATIDHTSDVFLI